MPRPAAVLALIALLVGGLLALPAVTVRAVPAGLPDLYVTPADMLFIDGNGTPVNDSMPGAVLHIDATIHNAGTAGSGPFTASFFENGALLESVLVNGSVAAGNSTLVSLLWETYLSLVGPCEISVKLDCPAGDANSSNNTAGRTIRLHPVAPVLDITMDRPVVEVETGGGAGQLGRLTGRVNILIPFNQTAVVQLLTEMDNDWACAAQPASLWFAYSFSNSFTVSFVVPPEAEGGSSANLTVAARASSEGYVIRAQATCRITVKPVHGISIECERAYVEIKPGETARFALKVTNTGNAVTDYSLDIANLRDLEARGWTVGLGRPNMTGVRPGETRTVNLTARSPDEFTIWKSEPSVFIVNSSTPAQNGTEGLSYKFPVYAYEKGASTWGEAAYCLAGVLVVCWVLFLILGTRKGADGDGKGPEGQS